MIQEFILENLITIIFIILFICAFIKGFNAGFLKKIVSFGSLIATIIITKTFTPVLASVVKDYTNIEATLSDLIYSVFIKTSAYDKFNLKGFEKIFNTGDIDVKIKESICTNIANVLINLFCGIILFIIVLILLKLLIKVLGVVDYIPLVGEFNKILGGLLGIFEVVVISWVVFTVFGVLDTIPQVGIIVENVKKSPIAGILYNNNLVYSLFSNLFSIVKKP